MAVISAPSPSRSELAPYGLSSQTSVSGKIVEIDATIAGNMAFRVYLDGLPKFCGTDSAWGYIDTTDGNYQGYVSLLTSAFMSDRIVTIYSQADARGLCQIYYVVLRA